MRPFRPSGALLVRPGSPEPTTSTRFRFLAKLVTARLYCDRAWLRDSIRLEMLGLVIAWVIMSWSSFCMSWYLLVRIVNVWTGNTEPRNLNCSGIVAQKLVLNSFTSLSWRSSLWGAIYLYQSSCLFHARLRRSEVLWGMTVDRLQTHVLGESKSSKWTWNELGLRQKSTRY